MEQNQAIAEIRTLLHRFFRDQTQVDRWLGTVNPLLGDLTPDEMTALGRADRLLRWIKLQID